MRIMARAALALLVLAASVVALLQYIGPFGQVLFGHSGHLPWSITYAMLFAVLGGFLLKGAALPVVPPGLRSLGAWYWGISQFYLPLSVVLVPSLPGGGYVTWAVLAVLVEGGLSRSVWPYVKRTWAKRDLLAVRLGRTPAPWFFPVELAGEDRFLHTHVLGPTGSGKSSSVLLPLIRQDLDAGSTGLLVIDPKGDLADAAASLAQEGGRQVVQWRPGQGEGPHLNPLAGERVAASEATAYVLEKALGSEQSFYREMGSTLVRTAVLALKEYDEAGADLAALLRFLTDREYRREVLIDCTDPVVRAFYRDQFSAWTAAQQQQYTVGISSTLTALLAHPGLRTILAAPSNFSLGQAMGEGALIFLALPLADLGLAGALFGRFLLAMVQREALARPKGSPAFFLYVDEFQNFVLPSFADFLATARSYRVGAVLAHQNLDQLPKELRPAVLANARNRIILSGTSSEDLAVLRESLGQAERWYVDRIDAKGQGSVGRHSGPKFDPGLIRQMPRGQALVQLSDRGRLRPPVLCRLNHIAIKEVGP